MNFTNLIIVALGCGIINIICYGRSMIALLVSCFMWGMIASMAGYPVFSLNG